MICRYCHHEFDVDSSLVGQDLHCPNCNSTVNVSEKIIVRQCPSCKTQLSVEVWMLGTTVPCPVCQHGVKLSLDAATSRIVFGSQDAEKEAGLSLSPGDVFGKYKIESCLGVGGMGEVYLATHSFLGTSCAIKLMRKNATIREEDKQRLLREARLTSSIRHQNLIAVLDADIDPSSGMLYIVMEYVDGISIDQILDNGPMPEERVLRIIREVTEALQAAEEMQIVHRDIKPANIMLTSRGKVKLADLGIAKADSETSVTLTMDSAILGTPHYASPEQLRSSHKVDSRADIYSLGATMYHMLSGNYPFPGDSVFSIMAQVLEKDPIPLQDIAPISSMTAGLVQDMMAKKAEDRPANMTDLITRIDRILQFLQTQKKTELVIDSEAAVPGNTTVLKQPAKLELRPRENTAQKSAPSAKPTRPATSASSSKPLGVPPTGSQKVPHTKPATQQKTASRKEKESTGDRTGKKTKKMYLVAGIVLVCLFAAAGAFFFISARRSAQKIENHTEKVDDMLDMLEAAEVRPEHIHDLKQFNLQGRAEFAAAQSRKLAAADISNAFVTEQKVFNEKLCTRLQQELQNRQKNKNAALKRVAGTLCGNDGEDLLAEAAQFLLDPPEDDPQSAKNADFYRMLKDYATQEQDDSNYRNSPGGIALRSKLAAHLNGLDPLVLVQSFLLFCTGQEGEPAIAEQTMLKLLHDLNPNFSYSKFPASALELPESVVLALLEKCWDEIDGFSYGKSNLLSELTKAPTAIRPAVITALLEAGCRTDIPNSQGYYPMHWALKKKINSLVSDLLLAAPELDCKQNGQGLVEWCIVNKVNWEALELLRAAGAVIPQKLTKEQVDPVYHGLWDNQQAVKPVLTPTPKADKKNTEPSATETVSLTLPPYIPGKQSSLEKPESSAIAAAVRDQSANFNLTGRTAYARKKLAQIRKKLQTEGRNYNNTQALQFYTALNDRLQKELQQRNTTESTQVQRLAGTLCPEGRSLMATMQQLFVPSQASQSPAEYYRAVQGYASQCQNDSQYKDSEEAQAALQKLKESRANFDPLIHIQILLHFVYGDEGITPQTMLQLLTDLEPDFSYSKFPPEALELPEAVILALLNRSWDEVDGVSYGKSNLITELSRANQGGRINVVSALLTAGCNVDIPDIQGMYPLHWAIKNSQFLWQFLIIAPDMQVKVKGKGVIEWGMNVNMLYSTAQRLLQAGAPLPNIPEDDFPPTYRSLLHHTPRRQ